MTKTQQLSIPTALPPLGNFDAYTRHVKSIKDLTIEEETFLFQKMKNENSIEAAKILISSQLKNVLWIAQQYKGYGIPIEDLVQEGNIGLMKAVKNYDLKHKVRLYTYAIIWIKSEIQSYIIKNWRLVKIATTNSLKKLFFNFKSLQNELKNHNISDSELVENIANKLAVSKEDVLNIKSYFENNDLEMDSLVNENGEPIFQLHYDTTPQTLLEDKTEERLLNNNVQKALLILDEREKEIIKLKFFTEDKFTNKEISEKLKISAERVRQIEKNAFEKIKPFLNQNVLA